MKKRPIVFIMHINLEIEKIEKNTKDISKSLFSRDENLKDATIRRIEIIGEAIRNLPKEFKDKYPFVEWKAIVGMRDKLIHQYFGVDIDKVWEVVKKEIPDLKEKINQILKELEK